MILTHAGSTNRTLETLDSLWSRALKVSGENCTHAISLWREWIAFASRNSIEAPEAYFNLANCEWISKQSANAVLHLLDSTRLLTSPLPLFRNLMALAQTQIQLGASDNLAESVLFQGSFLLNAKVTLALGILGAWCLILSLITWYRQRGVLRTSHVQKILLALCLLFSSVSATGVLLESFFKVGVLDSPQGLIQVLEQGENGTKTLGELPSGTLVWVHRNTRSHTEILEPFNGWVERANLRLPGESFQSNEIKSSVTHKP